MAADGDLKVARSVGHGIILVMFCYLIINLSQFFTWFGWQASSESHTLCPVNLYSYLFYESISSVFFFVVSTGIIAAAMAMSSGLSGHLATFFMVIAIVSGVMRMMWNFVACYWIDTYPSACRNSPIYKMALASVILFFVMNVPVVIFHGRLITEKLVVFLNARFSAPNTQLKSGINLKSLLNNHTYSDVTLEVDSVKFFAHKAILAARCDYFAKLLFGGMKESIEPEIRIKEMSAKSFLQILEFIYTNEISNLDINCLDDVVELMRCVDLLSFNLLKDFLEMWLEPKITASNIVSIMVSAHKYNYATERFALAKMSKLKMKVKASDAVILREVPDLFMKVVSVYA